MKRKINGIITIPAGEAQAEPLEIDSPEFEILAARLERGETDQEVNVHLQIMYYYNQGELSRQRLINKSFLWADLNDSQKAMIGEMIGESWNLMLSIPDHSIAE